MKSVSDVSGPRRERATIGDVAARAEVSPATVSRVLNGVENVQDEYRRRVLAAIEELDYEPNRLASNLRRSRVAMLGVVVSDIENPHFTEAVRAVEDAAFARGYRVLVCNTDESVDKQREYLKLLAAERVAGVILSPSEPDAPEIKQLLDLGMAVVAFDRAVADPRADLVAANNTEGVEAAVEHLVGLGNRRIGMVAGPPGITSGDERREGYLRGLDAHGLEPAIADGGFRIDGGRRAVDELLAAHPELTAVIFANNLMTLGGLHGLSARGVPVPADLSVIGVDDPFWGALVSPPLTTLAQPVREMAKSAVEILFRRVDGDKSEPERIMLDLELRVRSSCGPPRSEGA
jgi:DNA-binding LacI/PurR family transcriptional regulator